MTEDSLEQLALTIWADIIYKIFLKKCLLESQCGSRLNRLRITRTYFSEAERG